MNDETPGITDRQKQLLGFLQAYITEHGYPPTVRESMGAIAAKSTSTVTRELQLLHQLGWIKRGNGSRMITLVDRGADEPGSD